MSTLKTSDESSLHAYFDGELGSGDTATIESWLASHPDARSDIDKWQRQKSALKARFDGVVDEDIPGAIRDTLEQNHRQKSFWKRGQIALGAALFALGALSGWMVSRSGIPAPAGNPAIVEQALEAHLVYVTEKRHPVEVEVDQKAHLVKWLSKRLGHKLNVPDLSSENFALIGGRLLPSREGPAAQFMYEDRTGKRITLYIARNPSGNETSFQLKSEEQASSFFWLDKDLGYALAGGIDENRLLALAHLVYQQVVENEL